MNKYAGIIGWLKIRNPFRRIKPQVPIQQPVKLYRTIRLRFQQLPTQSEVDPALYTPQQRRMYNNSQKLIQRANAYAQKNLPKAISDYETATGKKVPITKDPATGRYRHTELKYGDLDYNWSAPNAALQSAASKRVKALNNWLSDESINKALQYRYRIQPAKAPITQYPNKVNSGVITDASGKRIELPLILRDSSMNAKYDTEAGRLPVRLAYNYLLYPQESKMPENLSWLLRMRWRNKDQNIYHNLSNTPWQQIVDQTDEQYAQQLIDNLKKNREWIKNNTGFEVNPDIDNWVHKPYYIGLDKDKSKNTAAFSPAKYADYSDIADPAINTTKLHMYDALFPLRLSGTIKNNPIADSSYGGRSVNQVLSGNNSFNHLLIHNQYPIKIEDSYGILGDVTGRGGGLATVPESMDIGRGFFGIGGDYSGSPILKIQQVVQTNRFIYNYKKALQQGKTSGIPELDKLIARTNTDPASIKGRVSLLRFYLTLNNHPLWLTLLPTLVQRSVSAVTNLYNTLKYWSGTKIIKPQVTGRAPTALDYYKAMEGFGNRDAMRKYMILQHLLMHKMGKLAE